MSTQSGVRFMVQLSLLLGAVLLVPSGAHVIEMHRKLMLEREAYFTVQQIYLGWSLFGIAIVAKIVLDLLLGWHLRGTHRAAAHAAWGSAVLISLGLVVFFAWVQPANVATHNWSVQPADWASWRRQWEYGHLAIAILTALALAAAAHVATRIDWRGSTA